MPERGQKSRSILHRLRFHSEYTLSLILVNVHIYYMAGVLLLFLFKINYVFLPSLVSDIGNNRNSSITGSKEFYINGFVFEMFKCCKYARILYNTHAGKLYQCYCASPTCRRIHLNHLFCNTFSKPLEYNKFIYRVEMVQYCLLGV